MTIDSAEKRRSAAMVGVLGLLAGPGVTPNADTDSEWRQQVGYGYSGIAVGAGGLSPWWMLPEPLPAIVRRAPALIESSVLPPEPLVLALHMRAEGFAFKPRRVAVAPRARLVAATVAWAPSGQLLMLATGRLGTSVRQRSRGNLTHMASARLSQRVAMRANGTSFWPHEPYELLMLGMPVEVVLQELLGRDYAKMAGR